MKCAIITPIGPGHREAYELCKRSIEIAVCFSKGPFHSFELIPIFDLDGKLGRSKARNLAVKLAKKSGCEWVYFLDADDVMYEEAFKNVNDLISDYDAVWGLICEAKHDKFDSAKIRENQIIKITSIETILNTDPFLTLQMGVFVRTSVAYENPFDENLDTGEDFKFYLSLWQKYRCVKIDRIFFINIRGNHSTGPRSANGIMWRKSVENQIRDLKTKRYPNTLINYDTVIIFNKEEATSIQLAERCLASCKKYQINASLVDGVPRHEARSLALDLGYNLESFDYLEYHKVRPLRDGQIGCFLAHRKQWQRCVESGRPLLILEHDAIAIKPIEENYEFFDILNFQRKIWDDSSWPWHLKVQKLIDNEKIMGNAKYYVLPGTSAYAVHPDSAFILLNSSKNMLPVDLYINKKTLKIDDYFDSCFNITNEFSLVE